MSQRIAVTSTGESATSEMDQRFGRARYFLIRDQETGEWTAVDNSKVGAVAHGAGIQAAQELVDRKVSVVLTGDCGPKATAVLEAAGIEIRTGYSGSVQSAFKQYERGLG